MPTSAPRTAPPMIVAAIAGGNPAIIGHSSLRSVGPLRRSPPRCALGPPLRGGSLPPSLSAAGAPESCPDPFSPINLPQHPIDPSPYPDDVRHPRAPPDVRKGRPGGERR